MMNSDPILTLPGLEGLQMVGQWTGPFMGTVISSVSGRQAIHILRYGMRISYARG